MQTTQSKVPRVIMTCVCTEITRDVRDLDHNSFSNKVYTEKKGAFIAHENSIFAFAREMEIEIQVFSRVVYSFFFFATRKKNRIKFYTVFFLVTNLLFHPAAFL